MSVAPTVNPQLRMVHVAAHSVVEMRSPLCCSDRMKAPKRLIPADQEYSIAEVAALLHVHPLTVHNWIRDGLLEARRYGPRIIRIRQSALDAMHERSA